MQLSQRISEVLTWKNSTRFLLFWGTIYATIALSRDTALLSSAFSSFTVNNVPLAWELLRIAFTGPVTEGPVAIRVMIVVGTSLLAFNVALLVSYTLKLRNNLSAGHISLGLGGVALLIAALQCFSCAAVFGIFAVPLAALPVVGALPISATGFGIIALSMLTTSSALLFKKVTDPLVC